MARERDEPAIFLSMQPAGLDDRHMAMAVALLTAAAFAVLAPFASEPLAHAPIFLPSYQSALVVFDLITAVLLFREFGILRWNALLVLAGGYLFSAFMAVFHLLSFPGLFAASGLLGPGPQTTAWLYFLWHLGFPASVIVYALLRDDHHAPVAPSHPGLARAVLGTSVAALAAATALLLVATKGHDLLPAIVGGEHGLPARRVVAWATGLVTLAALPALWRRRRLSILDLWLMVVVVAWLCDVAQSAVFDAGRFSWSWYAGRIYGLLASAFLLAVLLFEDSKLYRRLAEAYAAERRQRRLVEERTAELDALNQSLEQRVGERTAALESSNRELRTEVARRRSTEEELRLSRSELQEFAEAGATAREQERNRLARELHDELDQALLALKIGVGRLGRHVASGDADAASRLAEMREVIDATLAATKRIAADLRPLILDDLGFNPATRWLAEEFAERHGIACDLAMDPPGFDLGEPHSTVVFRVLQESLTNVARHARASRVEIELNGDGEEVRLRVRDDGRGFDAAAGRRPNAFGLLGLRERVHLVSGRVRIDSAPGRGTLVEVWIPLRQPPRADGPGGPAGPG